MQRLAYELLINTGARVSDAFRLGKVHEKNNTLTWKPAKTTEEHDEREEDEALEVSIPIHQNLRTAIDATPSSHLIYCVTSHGTPFQSSRASLNGLLSTRTSWIAKAVRTARFKEGGSKKRLAEAGVGEFMLMPIMGWKIPIRHGYILRERIALRWPKRVWRCSPRNKITTKKWHNLFKKVAQIIFF